MVTHAHPGDDDPIRFPRNGDPDRPAENLLQIRLDPDVARFMPTTADMNVLMASDVSPDLSPRAAPIAQLLKILKSFGAISIQWPLDVTPGLARILTPEEQAERQAILEVAFPPQANLVDVAAAVRSVPGVRETAPVPEDAPPLADDLLGTDDQDLDKQWYVFRVKAHKAWKFATGKAVVIGDVDYGFRITHEDLINIEADKAFNSHDGSQEVGHGTHVSHGTAVLGLAGAARDNGRIVGIAYDARLWPIQANSGPGPKIPGDKWGRGIDYILETDSGGRRKVAILENETKPGGCYEMVLSTRVAIQQAIAHEVVVVVAAGNGNRDVSLSDAGNTYPESGSILVGATGFHTSANPRSCSSNYGPRITVSAPGYGPSDVTCGHDADDDYRPTFGGTSGAAPKVAAACALILEVNAGLTHADVKEILIKTGSEVLTSPNRPAGVFLDVAAAVSLAK